MAAKDLTAHVRVTGTDEIGRVGTAFNTSLDAIQEVLHAVAKGADTLTAATTEISTRFCPDCRQRALAIQQTN